MSIFPGSLPYLNFTFHISVECVSFTAALATCLPRASAAAVSVPALCLIVVWNSTNLSHRHTVCLQSLVTLVFLLGLCGLYIPKNFYTL
jgi:hypothetical protein